MALALEGIKILDLSWVPVGHYCTMILGDLGAEVVKVEPTFETGLPAGLGVSPRGEEGRRIAAFNPQNRNKKSIVLNLRTPQGREVFYKLAEKADVILEGFRPGVTERLGVDYQTIAKINPRIIYCSISGYGQDGPYRDLPGHDANYISIGGALGLIGLRDGPPIFPQNLVADYAGGSLHGVMGILTALIARERTGRGQHVDIAMTDGVVSLLSLFAFEYFCHQTIEKRGEGLIGGAMPFYSAYQTKDGNYITIGCIEPHFWENICRALGREDFIPHQYVEGEKREEILSYFREVFRTKTRDEWFDLLKEKNIPIGKVYSIDEVFTDHQILYRRMVEEIEHPTLGKVRQVGIAMKFSDTPGSIRSLSPLLGEHTEEILQDLGYTEEQIEELRKAGATM